ncbi:hypothetical protein BC940DRAFT_329816 [Gongronella butleri]|nr:hypothetical protein BC940DRAFT_329816 [Gongronella butleri]
MAALHLVPTEQYSALADQLLLHHQPSSTHFVGWFSLMGHYASDHLGRAKVFSTHTDPTHLPPDEPVVLVINSYHRLRVYLSTEHILNEAVGKDVAGKLEEANWTEKAPLFFPDRPDMQTLYEKSVQALEPIMKQLMQENNGEIFMHGVNTLWHPLFSCLFDVDFYGPCLTFVRDVNDLDAPIDTKYTVTSLEDEDVDEVVQRNKILYDREYVLDCCKLSVALRDNDKPIAWAFTHRDVAIGGLHVIPEYRRQGLASVVTTHLMKRHADFFAKTDPAHPHYIASIVESTNPASQALFDHLGFARIGTGMAWTLLKQKKNAE